MNYARIKNANIPKQYLLILLFLILVISCKNTINNDEIIGIEISRYQKTCLLGEIPDISKFIIMNIYSDSSKSITTDFSYSITGSPFTTGNKLTFTVISTINSLYSASVNITVSDTLINTGLPVIYIDTLNKNEIDSREDYIKMNLRIDDNEYPIIKTGFKDEIRGRGNSTWNLPKKPYRIRFENDTSLFGLTPARNWVLLANYFDPSLLMNTVAFELGHRIGRFNYVNNYIHVDVVLNNSYQGSYLLTEHSRVGPGRVEIDETDGFLVELDTYYDEEPKFRTPNYDLPVMIKSHTSNYEFIINAINEFEALLFDDNFPNNGYRDLINMDTFIDFILINDIVMNRELLGPRSVFLHKKDGLICMGHLWDFDGGYGHSIGEYPQLYFDEYTGLLPNYNITRTINNHIIGKNYFNRFFDDPVFKEAYKIRWNEIYNDLDNILFFMDIMKNKIYKSHLLDYNRWYLNEKHGNVHVRMRYWLDIDYDNVIKSMKAWYFNRIKYMNLEINN